LSDQISSLSKSRYSHIRELCCIRPYFDSKTASNIDSDVNEAREDERVRPRSRPKEKCDAGAEAEAMEMSHEL